MSDRRLRELERLWRETGDLEDRKRFEREHIRAGLGKLPRLKIVHYIDDEFHGHLGSDGEFKISKAKARRRSIVITSRCAVELFPRGAGYGWKMKPVYFTERPVEVTCKTCIKSLNKPDVRIRYRTHYAPGSRNGRERGVIPVPVCGRDDSEKFTQTFTYRMPEVNCPTCRRIMRKGHRSSRKPVLA